MSKTKLVLGKGLDALLSRSQPRDVDINRDSLGPDDGRSETTARIRIDLVKPNPFQPRLDFDPIALDELKQSIMQKGVIQPITVRRTHDSYYEMISGERRLRAASEAGMIEIPAFIIQVSSQEEMLELALIENLQREHLNPIEIAISYQRLIKEINYTQEDVARKIGKDRTTVTNFIRLLKLPSQIQDSLRKGDLNMGHARALLSLQDEAKQIALWKKIVKQGLSVRRVEQLVKEETEKKSKPAISRKTTADSHTGTIESKLREIFGTKVTVRTRSDGSGEIIFEYYSFDDLDRLLDMFEIINQRNSV
jgi:ParB family transcriptional regulator, chromosome partitioning protein